MKIGERDNWSICWILSLFRSYIYISMSVRRQGEEEGHDVMNRFGESLTLHLSSKALAYDSH